MCNLLCYTVFCTIISVSHIIHAVYQDAALTDESALQTILRTHNDIEQKLKDEQSPSTPDVPSKRELRTFDSTNPDIKRSAMQTSCETGCCTVQKQYTSINEPRRLWRIIGECCHENDFSFCARSDTKCKPAKDFAIPGWVCFYDNCNEYNKVGDIALKEKKFEERGKNL